ncbi:hypothetical protein P7H12_14780 [Paenibacillus larvae]|nr:hypothetical protein [Paenibacillus larvae]MDT2264584.1 hypothetical protein [Paenibacillus larvae]
MVRKAAERSERKVKAGRRAVEADEPEAQFYEDYEEELPSKKRKNRYSWSFSSQNKQLKTI